MISTDLELVERLRDGDRTAFEAFFREYYPKLFRFALRRLSQDSAAAEDAAQLTICSALKSLHTYRGEAPLITWLCTICRRQLSSHSSHQRNVIAMREDDAEVQAALATLLDSAHYDPLNAAAAGQIQGAVLAALDYLPGIYADILEWKYVHEFSVEEIGHRIGRSAKATESLLTRARSAFREAFQTLRSDDATASSR